MVRGRVIDTVPSIIKNGKKVGKRPSEKRNQNKIQSLKTTRRLKMAKKKNNDVRMIAFNNGVSAVCQYNGIDNDFLSISNPVMLENDAENERINMNPMLRMGARDTEVQVPIANVDLIYTPTDGLIEEYIGVFVEETKEATVTSNEETPETVEV